MIEKISLTDLKIYRDLQLKYVKSLEKFPTYLGFEIEQAKRILDVLQLELDIRREAMITKLNLE